MGNIDILKLIAKENRTFTFERALKISGITKANLKKILYRLERKGWVERIEKGKYMIIPLEAEKGKYTLNEFIIGSLLVNPYCIAYWSALNYYGLTEQIPTTVFIQTPSRKKKQEIEVFGVNYRCVRVKVDKFFGIRKEWIEETPVNISDMEKTIIDCLDKPHYCGGLVEVAKALRKDRLDIKKLTEYALKIGNTGVIRRLGYLCEILARKISLPEINTRNYLYLDPTMPKKGTKNAKYRMIINLDENVIEKLE